MNLRMVRVSPQTILPAPRIVNAKPTLRKSPRCHRAKSSRHRGNSPRHADNSRAHFPPISRPHRLIQKPIRYRDESYINPDDIVTDVAQVKVKRILAQRNSDTIEYLLQLVWEPAHNAAWRKLDELNKKKTRKLFNQRPLHWSRSAICFPMTYVVVYCNWKDFLLTS